jgi:uncharacterized protein
MSKGIELTERKLEGKVVAGIDTHADTHWLCVLDERHRVALLSTPDGFEGTWLLRSWPHGRADGVWL